MVLSAFNGGDLEHHGCIRGRLDIGDEGHVKVATPAIELANTFQACRDFASREHVSFSKRKRLTETFRAEGMIVDEGDVSELVHRALGNVGFNGHRFGNAERIAGLETDMFYLHGKISAILKESANALAYFFGVVVKAGAG